MIYRSGYAADTAKHAYVRQSYQGVPFANAVANVAFNHENKVVAYGSSFVKPSEYIGLITWKASLIFIIMMLESINASKPTISQEQAVAAAEVALNGKYNNHPITLEYVRKPVSSVVVITHRIALTSYHSR